eukprot:6099622-Amphidinium_carterae.1
MESESAPSLETPSQMQQVLSTASLKELQRQGSIITSLWTSVADAGDFVLGSIRPTRASSK